MSVSEQQGVDIPWHQYDVEDALRRLNTSRDGLLPEEARKRLERYGPNTLPRERRFRLGLFLLGQFKSPLVYILLAGGAISIGVGHALDAAIIFTAVIVNIGIGFYQEYSS